MGTDIFIKVEYIARALVKIKSIPDWHLFISRMETKWTKWYAMTSHVIAYRSLELLFCTHTFHFNCFFDDFSCVFTQIRCLSRVLPISLVKIDPLTLSYCPCIGNYKAKPILAFLCDDVHISSKLIYLITSH